MIAGAFRSILVSGQADFRCGYLKGSFVNCCFVLRKISGILCFADCVLGWLGDLVCVRRKPFFKMCLFLLVLMPKFIRVSNRTAYLARYCHQEESFEEEIANSRSRALRQTVDSLLLLQRI